MFSIHESTEYLNQHISDVIVKVYMTDFFICSIKSLQCTDKYSKNLFLIAIFLPRVLLYQKRQISLPVGYKTARPEKQETGNDCDIISGLQTS